MATNQKLTTNLWFDTKAEEAAHYYTSIFKDSSMGKITQYNKAGQEIHKKKPGTVMTVEFEVNGQSFLALNGGPDFHFNESISFIVKCKDQTEIDYYWEKLSAGGDPKAQICGWLKDKYGLSWQIVPTILSDLVGDSDTEKAERALDAMMQMKKIDIKQLKAAHDGKLEPAH